jgi:ribosomal protein S18 acetylase RimI-like enzyme
MTVRIATREEARAPLRALLDPRSPADALAVYYALHHPPERTTLVTASETGGRVIGFLVRARTGLDLFRPLVTLRARDEATVAALVREGLPAGQPVYLTVPLALGPWLNKQLTISDAEVHRLYLLRAERHQPILNVLTLTSRDATGAPRCEIRPGGELGAVAGVNWQSPDFAEIYVYTDPAARGRGWGKSVVSTLAGLVLKSGRTPLYVVAESNDYSIRLAEAVGFEDTGFREYVAQAVRSEA